MKRLVRSVLGVTLLEIMLVLAIAAMIIVMSVRYYQSATSSQQANALVEQLQAITATADNLAQSSGSYQAAGISNATLKPLLPGGDSALLTPWGTAIIVADPTPSTYNVSVTSTPTGVCPLVVSKLATNNHYSALDPADPSDCASGSTIKYTYKANP